MEEDISNSGRQAKYSGKKLNWWLIRRMETIVFASLLLAVPFLAVRIMETASTALTVQNSAVDLVRDLLRAREIARDFNLKITVSSIHSDTDSAVPDTKIESSSYLIQNGKKTIEQVLLPRGVAVIGSVSFDEKGLPTNPSSFLISKGSKSVSVDIDSKGQASVH